MTGLSERPWTIPAFLPATHWEWADLIPDGSLQYRCWKRPENRGTGTPYSIEVRRRVGRVPTFAVEPNWSKSKSSTGRRSCTTDNFRLELITRPYSYAGTEIMGLRVTNPYGYSRDVMVLGRYVRVAPTLLVEVSSQGFFYWKNGSYGPPSELIMWSAPYQRTLRSREWTLLSEEVRAKVGRKGIRVETQSAWPVRRHWWSLRRSLWTSYGKLPLNTAHEYVGGTLRVTFRPDCVVEIQCAAMVDLG